MPSMKLKLLPRSIEEAWQIAERENPNVNSALFREEAARYAVDKVRGEAKGQPRAVLHGQTSRGTGPPPPGSGHRPMSHGTS